MAKVFITGSSDGLGLHAAKRLVADGHEVVLHARNNKRAGDAWKALSKATEVVVGDFNALADIHAVARQANALGPFDAVIHNAGVYDLPKRTATADKLELTFSVNVLAPYVLTATMTRSPRLIYLSSGLHRNGSPNLGDPQWVKRAFDGMQAYCDSKLFLMALMRGVARLWPDVIATGLEPGWVATKMGGPNAPDDLALGSLTQAWLAVSDDPEARESGSYFFHQKPRPLHASARDERFQEKVLTYCADVSGVALPRR
jgi:NAD(P)-dependent dehydrogenase (short-subunit alcohol dehydrogenase family)